MEPLLPWIVALVVLLVALIGAVAWRLTRERKPRVIPLPTEWSLAPRPVFSTDERRVYRQLREALPHHIVLSKLPLVRFCQPNDPQEVRFWYELLGSIHVTFAICSANGRVLAAIDLDTDRGNSRRVLQIKQSVLGACRVRYLRCPVDHLPSVAELQLLVPQSAASSRGPQPAPSRPRSRDDGGAREGGASRRRERNALWQDSSFFQDSFFAPDNRLDASMTGEFPSPRQESGGPPQASAYGENAPDDLSGVVVESEPRYPSTGTHH
ncbi:MAG: DUF2726 domain-containing protein [Pseudomonadota bacterium]